MARPQPPQLMPPESLKGDREAEEYFRKLHRILLEMWFELQKVDDLEGDMEPVSDSGLEDAPSDGSTYGRLDGDWAVVSGGGGSTAWGTITGTLSSQTDLQTALDGKAATSHTHVIADVTDFTDNSANWDTAFGWGDHGTEGYLTDAPSDGSEYVRLNGAWSVASGGASWGSITGTLSAQTDLQTALDGKAASSHTHVIADVTDFTDNSSNWDTAFGWGDHSTQNYAVTNADNNFSVGQTFQGDLTVNNNVDIKFETALGADDGTQLYRATGDALRLHYNANVMVVQGLDDSNIDFRDSLDATYARFFPASGNVDLLTGNLKLYDDQYIHLGDSNDIRMYYDGTTNIAYFEKQDTVAGNLFFRNQSIGDTYIQANASDGSGQVFIQTRESGGSARLAAVFGDGTNTDAKLYYNGDRKLRTENGGVEITGNCEVTGNNIILQPSANNGNLRFDVDTGYDGDIQYYVNNTLTAIIRWDSATNQLLFQDRDPANVQTASFDFDTGDFVTSGAVTATGDVTGANLNVSLWNDASDGRPIGLAFDTGTGVLSLDRLVFGDITVDIDGRYSLISGGTMTGKYTWNVQQPVDFIAPGIESGNTTAHEIRTAWTVGNDRFYIFQENDGVAQFGRELSFDFTLGTVGEWEIEGNPRIGGKDANDLITTSSSEILPSGGTTGQVLEKIDGTDYNVQWATPSGGGGATWGSITGTLSSQTDLQTELDAKAGTATANTFTANQTINASSGTAQQLIDVDAATQFAGVRYTVGDSTRWFIGKNGDAESGSDAGSNFILTPYDDTGSSLGVCMSVERSTGNVDFSSTVAGADPVNNDDFVTKSYGDTNYGEYMVPIWAEENSGLGNNTYEWAFGNGANTPSNAGITIYVPTGKECHIVAMTGTTNNAGGTSVIEANINGTLQGANCNVTLSGRSGTNDSFTPVALSNGDRLTFRTTTAGTNSSPNTVCAWLRYRNT